MLTHSFENTNVESVIFLLFLGKSHKNHSTPKFIIKNLINLSNSRRLPQLPPKHPRLHNPQPRHPTNLRSRQRYKTNLHNNPLNPPPPQPRLLHKRPRNLHRPLWRVHVQPRQSTRKIQTHIHLLLPTLPPPLHQQHRKRRLCINKTDSHLKLNKMYLFYYLT